MGTIETQITSLAIVYSIVYSDVDQRKHQSSASLAFVRGIHRGPVNSPHKWPVTRKMFPFDDVIMHPKVPGCQGTQCWLVRHGFAVFLSLLPSASNINHTLIANKLRSTCIACPRFSNYIFILDSTSGFNGLGKDNFKTRPETQSFGGTLVLQIFKTDQIS